MTDYSLKITYLLAFFMAISILLVFFAWKRKSMMSGLVLAYLMDFAILYVPGAWVYSNRSYSPESLSILHAGYDVSHVYYGFQLACYGLVAFFVGVIAQSYVGNKAATNFSGRRDPTEGNKVRSMARSFLTYGFVFNICLEVATRNIPSVNMIVAVSFKFFVIGLILYIWEAMKNENLKRFYMIFAIALLCLPLYTMVGDGFMSFAINALIPILGISIIYYKPKKHIVLLMICLGWLGASFFVNYMQVRGDLREAVWHESSGSKAFGVLEDMIHNFETFDSKKQTHLEVLDGRLNQSWLVGRAIEYIEQGNIDFAKGKSLNYALIAMVPRAIWPGKPSYGGSMGIVADYTGLNFAEGTSVGVGQVMEFYINHGLIGVISGFFILGFCMALCDKKAGASLVAGDYHRFVCWFLPGLGFLNAIGLIAETVGTIWISLIVYWMVSNVMNIGKHAKN